MPVAAKAPNPHCFADAMTVDMARYLSVTTFGATDEEAAIKILLTRQYSCGEIVSKLTDAMRIARAMRAEWGA